jgi:hypothetical protein
MSKSPAKNDLAEVSGLDSSPEVASGAADKTQVSKPFKREPLAIHKGKARIRKLVTRAWAGIFVLVIGLLLWGPRLGGPINLRWDASTYYVLGTALAEGKGYRLLNEPGEIEAVQYPPLLPLMVAAHQLVMGTSDYFKVGSALRLTYFVLSLLWLLMAYALSRQFLSPLYAFLVGAVTALSFSSFLWPSEVLYAEMPFAVVTMAFLLCHQRNDRTFFAALSGLLGAAAYLLRTAGLALLLAWIGESLFRRRFRQAVIRAMVSAVPILLWQIHVWKVTASDEYHHLAYSYQRADYQYANVTYGENSSLVDPFRPELGHVQLRDLGLRLAGNVAAVPGAIGESTVIPEGFVPYLLRQLQQTLRVRFSSDRQIQLSAVFSACLLFVGLLALVGGILVAMGRHWFLALYFALTVATIVITPFQNQFWRYLAPMTPLTLIFLFLALIAARNWFRRLRWGRVAGALVMMITLAGILLAQIVVATRVIQVMHPVSYYDPAGRERVFKLINYGGEWHALDPAFEWIRRNTAADAIIATTVPHLAYLRTGRKAVLPPFESDFYTAAHLLDEVPVSYLVVDRFGRPGGQTLLAGFYFGLMNLVAEGRTRQFS